MFNNIKKESNKQYLESCGTGTYLVSAVLTLLGSPNLYLTNTDLQICLYSPSNMRDTAKNLQLVL